MDICVCGGKDGGDDGIALGVCVEVEAEACACGVLTHLNGFAGAGRVCRESDDPGRSRVRSGGGADPCLDGKGGGGDDVGGEL